ncbi:MAG TPA: septation protein IspZ [Caulobacteraceae bacterium]|jgi:intracellular septation protein A|nr:septation protein IspZ [Caulobacteraceae bacterium]
MTTATETLPDAAELEGSGVHPIVHAGKWLAADLLSTLMFVGLYALTHNVYVATAIAIAAGVVQIVYLKLRRAPIDVMQWMSLGLVVVFGGASLYAHDPRFIMLKPTLIYVIIGGVMLKRGWMARYQPPLALRWSRDVSMGFGYVWAGLMFATGALNLALVAHGDPKLWAWFIGVFPIASKLGLFAVQYVATQFMVRTRMRAAGAL